jgi:hypothetical protein
MPARGPQSHHGSRRRNPADRRGAAPPSRRRARLRRWCPAAGNCGGVLVLLERRTGRLGELIVPLVATRAPGLSKLMLVVPSPWSCA